MVLTFALKMLLAFAGFLFHLLKQWGESIKKKEVMDTRIVLIKLGMNIIAIPVLIFIGDSLPSDLLVMSPLTCVIIGSFGSSMLSGFITAKKPSGIDFESKLDNDKD